MVAPFWHPIKLAGEAAMTDIITNGRLDIGIARGAYSFEYERMVPGMDAWSAGQRLREMIPAIKNLWKGDYEHNGEFWQFQKRLQLLNRFNNRIHQFGLLPVIQIATNLLCKMAVMYR